MAIKSQITGKNNNISADVIVNDECDCKALAVATTPYRKFENSIRFFTNSLYGSDMNQDASASGTPDKIHDGTDSVLWTATTISGVKFTFDSTDQNHTAAGSKSIKSDGASVGNVFQIAKGSNVTMSNYNVFTMWIYVDSNWGTGDSVSFYAWDTATNSQIGDSILIENYFDITSVGVWQKLSIDIDDLGAASSSTIVDAVRFQIISKQSVAPLFYIDDIQLEESSGLIAYTLAPNKGEWLHVEEFTISFADAYAGILADATMPFLSYDKILGETLTSGINYQREQDGVIRFSQKILNIIDFLQLAGTEISATGSDGVNTWLVLRVKHIEPLVLKYKNNDKLIFTISDNLSGLLHFRISAGCKVEDRS